MSEKRTAEETPASDTNSTIEDSHGNRLFCRYWNFEGTPKAIVFLCHGYGEHSGRYEKIATEMTNNGIMAFAHDHVGHGLSDGDRVHIDDFMIYVDGVIVHVKAMKDKYPHLPLFIYGHSMGGQIAVCSLFKRGDLFEGVVLNAPLLQFLPHMVTPFKMMMGRIVSFLCPQAPVSKINPDHLSSDPEVVEDFQNDPLCWHGWVKARQSMEMIKTTQSTERKFGRMKHPFLVQHGTGDLLTYYPGSQKLYDEAASTDKQIQLYEGAYHQLHNEPGIKEEVLQLAVDWILKRSQ